MYRGKVNQIHFVGIGGAGMSGIAEVLLNLGYRITGSDLRRSKVTERLEGLGCLISYGHAPENVRGADVVVVSSAIPPGNPEVREAHRLHIPVIERAEMLAELMRMKYGIAVAGSHGKTTTTSMIALVLAHGGLDPTAVIGGRLKGIGGGARLGTGEFLVAEADESDGTFLKLSPAIAVITNIDPEHLDHYGTFERLKETFCEFANKVPFYGRTILCLDHPTVKEIMARITRPTLTYGLNEGAEVRGRVEATRGFESRFRAFAHGRQLGEVTLQVPGLHNVQNALAAVACGLELELPFDRIREALEAFGGVERRLERKGEARGILVMDDYAHHPVEIRATLETLRGLGRRLVAVFQPHRFTRLRDLFGDFVTAFDRADLLFLTEIYPAGEPPIEGVTAEALFLALRERFGPRVRYVPDREEIPKEVLPLLQEGDLVVTLGAGNIYEAAEGILEALRGWTGSKGS